MGEEKEKLLVQALALYQGELLAPDLHGNVGDGGELRVKAIF